MNSILKLRSFRHERAVKNRVLAIESDPSRVAALRHVLSRYVSADFQIVHSLNDALTSIDERIPDLVLTSALLPPRDESAIVLRLKELPGTRHLQIITTPYFIDSEDPSTGRNVLNFWNRRRSTLHPFCDSETVGSQIEEYLAQARVRGFASNGVQHDTPPRPVVVPIRRKPESCSTAPLIADASKEPCISARALRPTETYDTDRRRAKRKTGGDVPSLWSVNLPAGGNVRLVNISSQGVLLETTSKVPTGRTVDMQLLGDRTDIALTARTTRSEVAAVDGLGVRYRVAAFFCREVELPGLESKVAPEAKMPGALSDLLARVLREIDSGETPSNARWAFERGLCRLLTADDVQIRQSPVVPAKDSESFYFTVPGRSARQPILQAIYARNRAPSTAEFKLLRTAANLAAVVLEFAPIEESSARRFSG